jgi:type VI protein secretion system component VasK
MVDRTERAYRASLGPMVVLGVILLLAAAALVLLLVTAGTSQDVVLDLVGDQQLTTAPVWIFVAGIATLLIAALGWMLIVRGTRRAVVRRKEMRRLRKAAGPQTAETAGTGADDGSVQHEPDRRLVRDVHSLRADEGVDPSATRPHAPEQDVDPEAPRHELRLDELEARERRRQT